MTVFSSIGIDRIMPAPAARGSSADMGKGDAVTGAQRGADKNGQSANSSVGEATRSDPGTSRPDKRGRKGDAVAKEPLRSTKSARKDADSPLEGSQEPIASKRKSLRNKQLTVIDAAALLPSQENSTPFANMVRRLSQASGQEGDLENAQGEASGLQIKATGETGLAQMVTGPQKDATTGEAPTAALKQPPIHPLQARLAGRRVSPGRARQQATAKSGLVQSQDIAKAGKSAKVVKDTTGVKLPPAAAEMAVETPQTPADAISDQIAEIHAGKTDQSGLKGLKGAADTGVAIIRAITSDAPEAPALVAGAVAAQVVADSRTTATIEPTGENTSSTPAPMADSPAYQQAQVAPATPATPTFAVAQTAGGSSEIVEAAVSEETPTGEVNQGAPQGPQAENILPPALAAPLITTQVDQDARLPVGVGAGRELPAEVTVVDFTAVSESAPVGGVQQAGRTQTTEAPQADQTARASTVEQVTEAVRLTSARIGQRLVIRLNPPELGEIRLTLRTEGRSVRGVLEVRDPRVFAELNQATPPMIQRLAETGVQMRRLDIVLTNESSPGQGNSSSPTAQGDQYAQQQGQATQGGASGGSSGGPAGGDTGQATDASAQQQAPGHQAYVTDDSINVWM